MGEDDSYLGVRREAFAPEFLKATDDLGAFAAAAIELQAECIEPSHLLLALIRIPGGITARLFAEKRITPEVFREAMQYFRGEGGGSEITGVNEASVSEATARLFAALADEAADGGKIGEREVLVHVLELLGKDVRDLLQRHASIDVRQWRDEVESRKAEPPPVYRGEEEALNLEVFSSGARRTLDVMCREATALGYERLTTPLLLYAMAVTPEGLLEQALHFLQADVRGLRERLFAALSVRRGSAEVTVALNRSCIELALDLVFQRAAEAAAAERSEVIRESHLLRALLGAPGGVTTRFFQDLGVETERVLRYGTDLYREPSPPQKPERERQAFSVEEARAFLQERVVGQDAAIERILPYVSTLQLGLGLGYLRESRPAASFLCCGPSGTGKTMMARVLAELIYGSPEDVLMFEMGQFNSRESINNFIGAPPGYVGFGEGKLTNGLRDNPRRVLLFDEVEKADPRVFDALLRLLDDGRISDPSGPVRDARESVIVLTSNQGGAELAELGIETKLLDEDEIAMRLRSILGEFFRPEFLNRVDEFILFRTLSSEDLLEIARRRIKHEAARMADSLGVELRVTEAALSRLVEDSLDERSEQAARGINRLIDTRVISPVLQFLFTSAMGPAEIERVVVDIINGSYAVREFSPQREERLA